MFYTASVQKQYQQLVFCKQLVALYIVCALSKDWIEFRKSFCLNKRGEQKEERSSICFFFFFFFFWLLFFIIISFPPLIFIFIFLFLFFSLGASVELYQKIPSECLCLVSPEVEIFETTTERRWIGNQFFQARKTNTSKVPEKKRRENQPQQTILLLFAIAIVNKQGGD